MKHVVYRTAVTLGLMLVLTTVIPAQSGMMGQRPMSQSEGAAESSAGGTMGTEGQGSMGMMGPQKMHGMGSGGTQDMPEGVGMPRTSRLVRTLKAELGLSDEQVKQLTQIFSQTTKARIKQSADLRITEIELGELLEADPVDMGQVEGKLKAIEGLRTTLRLSLIQGHEQAKGVLTPEQRQKLEGLHDRLPGMMGQGMMEMMGECGSGGTGMMGQGGMGGIGMMGPQMMQQMMRGMSGAGMREQPQSAPQTADMPQNLTQQDTRGPVKR